MSIKRDLGTLQQRVAELTQRAEEPMTDRQWQKLTADVIWARHEMIRLERLCKVEMGDAAFAEFEHAFAARVERTIRPDDTNVLRLRGRVQ